MAPATHHATCVAFGDCAVLIIGASGSGKSALALQLMAIGAVLIADDRVILSNQGQLTASCPPAIKGRIEARGVGILNAATQDMATVAAVIDMDQIETDRLPPNRVISMLGHELPLLFKVEGLHFASAVAQFLRAGRSDFA